MLRVKARAYLEQTSVMNGTKTKDITVCQSYH